MTTSSYASYLTVCRQTHLESSLNLALLRSTNIQRILHTHSSHPIITIQDVCLDIGHLSCATILFPDPLFPVGSVLSDCCPSQGAGGGRAASGMRSPLSQLSIPCCAKFRKLSHRQVVAVVRASPWVPVCVSVCAPKITLPWDLK